MTRTHLILFAVARMLVFLICMVAAYGMGLQDVARPSGVDAPELQPQLSEKMPVPFVDGRPVITPNWSAVLPDGDWNGCDGSCGEKPGVIDDEAPPVPLPAAVWFMLAGLGAVAAVKWRKA